MLAYVFWHRPAPGVAADAYEERLRAFHDALREDGRGPTAALRLAAVPWLDGRPGYEDWYLVEDFAALGALNAAAVSGGRRAPHDAAAEAAGNGTAGVMGHVAGPLLPELPRWSGWLAKPDGTGYPEFHAQLTARLPPGAAAWQRQMVLGPAEEYCVLAGGPVALPWASRGAPVTPVVAPGRAPR